MNIEVYFLVLHYTAAVSLNQDIYCIQSTFVWKDFSHPMSENYFWESKLHLPLAFFFERKFLKT